MAVSDGWESVGGSLKQLKGHVREQWGDLTDDELDQMAGRRQVLVGKLQERYGRSQDEVEQEVDEFFEKLEDRATFDLPLIHISEPTRPY